MYKMLDKRQWKRYAAMKDAFINGNATKADLVLSREEVLDVRNPDCSAVFFRPYWLMLGLKADYPDKVSDEKLSETLLKCKKEAALEKRRSLQFKREPEMFKGKVVEWSFYQKYDENYNTYDRRTMVCRLPWRLSDEEKNEFYEEFRIIPPAETFGCGRDCTGHEFTGGMSFMRCKDRTFILHSIHKDC